MNKRAYVITACLLPVLLSAQTREPQLWGRCSLDDFRQEPYSEWYVKNYTDYEPNPAIVEQLKQFDWKDYSVTVFLGTWCGDSRREVPRFIKTLDAAGFPQQGINASLYPEAWQPQASLAEALYDRGDVEQASQAIQKAIELNKDVRNVKSLLELEDEIKTLLTNTD